VADALERSKPGATWDAAEMVEERLTAIAVRLHDLGELKPELKHITESVRNEVFAVRNAVDRTWGFTSRKAEVLRG